MRPWREIAPTLAADVASGLGLGWIPGSEVTDWQAWVCGPDGQRLLLTPADSRENPTRIHVQTCFPWTPGNSVRSVESRHIGCSLARGPEQIAQDIARRLLPGYLEELAEDRRRIARAEAAEECRQVMLLRYERLLPGSRIIEHSQSVWLKLLAGHGEVRPSNDGSKASVKLDLIPADLTEQILHTVATWTQAHEAVAAT